MNARALVDAAARLSSAQRMVLRLAAGSGAVDESAVRAGTGWEPRPVAVTLAELTGKRLLRRSGAWWEPTERGAVVASALPGAGGRTDAGTHDEAGGGGVDG